MKELFVLAEGNGLWDFGDCTKYFISPLAFALFVLTPIF